MTLAPINKDKVISHCDRIIDNYDGWLVEFQAKQYANYLADFEKRKRSFPWRLFAHWMRSKPKTQKQYLRDRDLAFDDSLWIEAHAGVKLDAARRLKALCEASSSDVLLNAEEYNQITSEQ